MLEKIINKYKSIPIQAKATLWFVVCATLQKCISLITTPIFTRLMSTEQYGQFSIYNSWLQIITIITSFRLSWAVFNKGMSKYKEDRENYTSTMQTVTFVITIVCFGLFLIFHNYVESLMELPGFIIGLMFIELLFYPAVDFWTVKSRYEYKYKPVVIITLIMAVLNLVVGVAAVVVSTEKGYARIISCILINLIFGIVFFIRNRKKATTWFNKTYASFAVKFNLPLMLHYISQYIMDQFDRIMIQKMVSVATAGIYSLAYNGGMILKILTQSIQNAIVPWQYDKLENKKFKEMDDVIFGIFVLVATSCVAFSIVAPEIIKILADAKFYEAIYVVPPVTVGLFFLTMYNTFANIEFFYEQNKFTMYISMVGAVLNIVLNYFGIKMFGYVAAAYTTLICYVLFAFGHYMYVTFYVRKKFDIEFIISPYRLIVLSVITIVCGISVAFLYKGFIARYLIAAALCIAAVIFRNKIMGILKSVKKKKR